MKTDFRRSVPSEESFSVRPSVSRGLCLWRSGPDHLSPAGAATLLSRGGGCSSSAALIWVILSLGAESADTLIIRQSSVKAAPASKSGASQQSVCTLEARSENVR